MRQLHDQQYAKFTPKECAKLTLLALNRKDEAEANRLLETCPQYPYKIQDVNYLRSLFLLMSLQSLFFDICVRHYNKIAKANEAIFSYLDHCEDINSDKKVIAVAIKTSALHTSQIKALFYGFEQFCLEEGINHSDILSAIDIKDCCCDIDLFLSSRIEIDKGYAEHIKKLFLEVWSF